MKERVQKILSARGLASRRTAEQWILQGRVCVNGEVCTLGMTADTELDLIGRETPPVSSGEEIPHAQ